MQKDAAQIIALTATGFLFADDALSSRFLELTGMDGADIAPLVQAELHGEAASNQPSILLAILDFFMNFEPDLIAFADSADMDPQTVQKAWMVLGGNQESLG